MEPFVKAERGHSAQERFDTVCKEGSAMERTAKGVNIHYEQAGAAGKPVLLLHGWGCSLQHFQPILNDLQKDYRVTALDFPAHGQSGRPPEPWGVGEFAECVKAFGEQLGLFPCDIIAHSFGGRVALYMAAHWPELVSRLVITGGAGLKKEPTPQQKKRSEEYKKKKEALLGLTKLPLVGGMAQKSLKALQDKYSSPDYKALDDEMKKTFVKVINEDLTPLLPRIQASTLLIWGENDTETPLWMGQKMEQDIPDAGLVIFENDDHFAYLRQWPRFVAVVRAFLT